MEKFHAPRSNNPSERFEKIKVFGEQALHTRTGNEKNEVLEETFLFFRDFLAQQGFTEYQESSVAYKTLPDNKIIVRREDPRKIFELFKSDEGYTIGFQDDRYANCVTCNPQSDGARGIYNAFMEGFTNLNGVVTVIGFDADNTNDLIKMEDSVQNFHGLDRSSVRSYQGSVTEDAVKFITLRIPGHLLSEKYLTEDELEAVDNYKEALAGTGKGTPAMIFRTYLPPQPETTH